MTVRWISRGATEYVAKWQDMNLLLQFNPMEHKWVIIVNERRVRNRWFTARAAMEATETIVLRMLRELTTQVQAQQRPSSTLHIVHKAVTR